MRLIPKFMTSMVYSHPGSDTNQYPTDKSNDYGSKTNSSGSDTASTANSACPNCGTTLSININPNYCPQFRVDL